MKTVPRSWVKMTVGRKKVRAHRANPSSGDIRGLDDQDCNRPRLYWYPYAGRSNSFGDIHACVSAVSRSNRITSVGQLRKERRLETEKLARSPRLDPKIPRLPRIRKVMQRNYRSHSGFRTEISFLPGRTIHLAVARSAATTKPA
jgi:hypothetical protein